MTILGCLWNLVVWCDECLLDGCKMNCLAVLCWVGFFFSIFLSLLIHAKPNQMTYPFTNNSELPIRVKQLIWHPRILWPVPHWDTSHPTEECFTSQTICFCVKEQSHHETSHPYPKDHQVNQEVRTVKWRSSFMRYDELWRTHHTRRLIKWRIYKVAGYR